MKHWKLRYGKWSMNPSGDRPNFNKCAEEVFLKKPNGATTRQCSKPCGHGPDGAYCSGHAKQYAMHN